MAEQYRPWYGNDMAKQYRLRYFCARRMMSVLDDDIVAWLRYDGCECGPPNGDTKCLPCDAADEIESMRIERDLWKAAGDRLIWVMNESASSGVADEYWTGAITEWEQLTNPQSGTINS